MALSSYTKAGLRRRIVEEYGKVSNTTFDTEFINTAMQDAVAEFALRSGCVIGSARRARPNQSSYPTNDPGESLLLLPTGMFGPERVFRVFTWGTSSDVRMFEVPQTTEQMVRMIYPAHPSQGNAWMHSHSAERGMLFEWWYRRGARQIGFFPSDMSQTAAGTVIAWGRIVPDRMANDTSPCSIPPEYVPGVVSLACCRMASRDVDADEKQERQKDFAAKADGYTQRASLSSQYTQWAKED